MRGIGKIGRAALGLGLFGAFFAATTVNATAQNYPTRTVRLIVGFAPGDLPDVVARILATKLSEKWGQSVIVENREGANGTIASDFVAHTTPDGYTLVVVTPNHTTTPSLFKLNYDPIKSFVPITQLAASPGLIVVGKSLAVDSLKDLIALAKTKPGELNFGSVGPGSPSYMSMALLMQRTGIKLMNIPYKSSAAALTALLGDQIPVTVTALSGGISHVQAGTIKALAVTGALRSPALPTIPTVTEAADLPGFDVTTWTGVLAPVGTPQEIVTKLNTDIVAALKLPEIQTAMSTRGLTVVGSTPDQFGALIAKEIPLWKSILQAEPAK
jgi:tripartite-type tricarboxylate transporter receptor subunit TctC